MNRKDIYEDVCEFYELMLGQIPNKENLKRAMQETVSPDILSLFFLIPLTGFIHYNELKREVSKTSRLSDWLDTSLERLREEGFILAYDSPEGTCYERGNPVYMTEQQVRKHEDTPRRRAYAEFFDAIIEGDVGQLPNKSPYYRVLPYEKAISPVVKHFKITINAPIPNPSQILPFDKVSDMLKGVDLIGVAECYCRKSKLIVGKGCNHPLETCFVFDELAEAVIEIGNARKIDYDEAMRILRNCEDQGLIHHVDNCEDQIKSLCNCCSCSCVILKSIERGYSNAGAPSRYVVSFDDSNCSLSRACVELCPTHAIQFDGEYIEINYAKCIGCGLCVSACPEGALSLVLRDEVPRIFKTHNEMMTTIGKETLQDLIDT